MYRSRLLHLPLWSQLLQASARIRFAGVLSFSKLYCNLFQFNSTSMRSCAWRPIICKRCLSVACQLCTTTLPILRVAYVTHLLCPSFAVAERLIRCCCCFVALLLRQILRIVGPLWLLLLLLLLYALCKERISRIITQLCKQCARKMSINFTRC